MLENSYDNDALMNSLRFDIYYITSDQMYKRDGVFLLPVRNREFFIKSARNYFESCAALPRHESTYNILKDFLTRLKSSGEDVDRIIEWYKSLSGWGVLKSDYYWSLALWWWCKGAYIDHQKHLPKRRFDEFMSVVYRDFFLPLIKFRELTKHDEKLWVGDDGQRSEWDEFLWQIFFKENWDSPETLYRQYFDTINMMSFWKKNRYFLSLQEQNLILADMVDVLVLRDKKINWGDLATLEDTLTIDNWPDFDAVKRDW